MNYEIVTLEEKIVVGVSVIASNSDPKMGKIIAGLRGKLYNFNDGVSVEIKNKIDQHAIGSAVL